MKAMSERKEGDRLPGGVGLGVDVLAFVGFSDVAAEHGEEGADARQQHQSVHGVGQHARAQDVR
jgi:hypothetical protein